MDKDGEQLWNNAALANSVQELIESKPSYFKLIRTYAELRKEKYDALIDAGFTPEQSLHIITTTPIIG